MNPPMSGIHVAEVSWREHNGFLVQGFSGGNSGTCRAEEHRLGESCVHEVGQECGAIPAGKRRAAKINEVDFDSFSRDVLCQAGEKRIEIDFVDFRGPAFASWDRSTLLAYLVHAGLAEAVFFSSTGAAVPPTEALYKKAVVLAPGYFGHVDPAHGRIHTQMLAAALEELRRELGETSSEAMGTFCLSAAPLTPEESAPEIPDLLRRIGALLAQQGNVLLFRQRELYSMTALVNRYTKEPVRFVAGLSLLIRAFDDPYFNLEGRRLEALSRLFAQNVRIYAYPMTGVDLQESIKSLSATALEWSETNGWVSAKQLRVAPPLGHLYAYLLASNFLVPLQLPAALAAEA